MSFLNPAEGNTDRLPAPLFELRGFAARLDLSAMIAGAMLAIGLSRVGPSALVADFQSGGFGLYLIGASFVAFLGCVLFLQRTMNLSLSATSFGKPQALATTGIFKFTRNPIYLAFFLPLASLAYFSLATAMASVVIYVTLMNLIVIRKEERDLQGIFGEDYAAYRKAVPRWFA
jgi:protein-S-isoprenylcysteine O-methyltransferase Ste14